MTTTTLAWLVAEAVVAGVMLVAFGLGGFLMLDYLLRRGWRRKRRRPFDWKVDTW